MLFTFSRRDLVRLAIAVSLHFCFNLPLLPSSLPLISRLVMKQTKASKKREGKLGLPVVKQ